MEIQEIFEYLKDQLHCRTDAELAKKLNVQPATLSGWKTRNAIGTLLGELASKQIPVSIDQILHQNINGSIRNQTFVSGKITQQQETQSELDRQFDVAKRLIAGSAEKHDELLRWLKEFNKRMI